MKKEEEEGRKNKSEKKEKRHEYVNKMRHLIQKKEEWNRKETKENYTKEIPS